MSTSTLALSEEEKAIWDDAVRKTADVETADKVILARRQRLLKDGGTAQATTFNSNPRKG